MDECEKCGITGNKVRLFEVISSKGIVKICEKCTYGGDAPILRKPTTFQLKEAERKQTVYERLSGKPRDASQKIQDELKKENTTLRDIIDRNYKPEISREKTPRPDLIDNFHWAIMMARRSRKLSQEQLAMQIGESKSAIEMAEKGILPEDDNKLVNKLENSLGIKLIKKNIREDVKPARQPLRILEFNKESVENLTISDLQEMQRLRKSLPDSNSENKNLNIKKRKEETDSEDFSEEKIDIAGEKDLDEEIEEEEEKE